MEETLTEIQRWNLAQSIVNAFKREFISVHFSKNLMRTIKVSVLPHAAIQIEIPARVYNIKHFKETGVVVYHTGGYYKGGQRSYAMRINKTGGFSGKHKGYVERCLKEGISDFFAKENIKYKIKGL